MTVTTARSHNGPLQCHDDTATPLSCANRSEGSRRRFSCSSVCRFSGRLPSSCAGWGTRPFSFCCLRGLHCDRPQGLCRISRRLVTMSFTSVTEKLLMFAAVYLTNIKLNFKYFLFRLSRSSRMPVDLSIRGHSSRCCRWGRPFCVSKPRPLKADERRCC